MLANPRISFIYELANVLLVFANNSLAARGQPFWIKLCANKKNDAATE